MGPGASGGIIIGVAQHVCATGCLSSVASAIIDSASGSKAGHCWHSMCLHHVSSGLGLAVLCSMWEAVAASVLPGMRLQTLHHASAALHHALWAWLLSACCGTGHFYHR